MNQRRKILMISQRKLEANRLNAKKSTGPVTSGGKLISSRNALKTGKYAKVHQLTAPIETECQTERMPTLREAEAEIAELAKDFTRTFKPATSEERRYIKTLATAEWSIRQFESIFGLAVIALVKSARARTETAPRLSVVPRRQVAMRGTFIDDRCIDDRLIDDALPPAA
jgi:hypothetical protein